MTDLPATQKPVDLKSILSTPSRIDNSEGMSYLQSLPRRLVTLYLPLSIIVFVLLFPFYWMALTAIKPDEQLIDLETYSPFWTWNPTFKHFYKLLFQSHYPMWLWNTMYVAVGATVLSIFASALAASPIARLPYPRPLLPSCVCAFVARIGLAALYSFPTWCRPRSCSFRWPPSCSSTACSTRRW